MTFFLPSQYVPSDKVILDGITLKPYKRVVLELGKTSLFVNSIEVNTTDNNWGEVNNWIMFHTLITEDFAAIDRYESEYFFDPLKIEGECHNLFDFTDLSSFLLKSYPSISYVHLYSIYKSNIQRNNNLILRYLNCFGKDGKGATNWSRKIRRYEYWNITKLYSVIEYLFDPLNKCNHKVFCDKLKKNKDISHNLTSPSEWIRLELGKRIKDIEVANEYSEVLIEVMKNIRHSTSHEASFSNASIVDHEFGTVIYDWNKTKSEYEKDIVALLSLEHNIRTILHKLLLHSILGIDIFSPNRPLRSSTLQFGGNG